MRRLGLAIVLAAPLIAAAQVPVQYGHPPPPPYAYPPPPPPYAYPPPPPTMRYAPALPPLSPFYFNLGIGFGFGGLYDSYSWTPLSAYGGGAGLAYHVEAGPRLLPQLLLGFDLTGLSTFQSGPYGGNGGITLIDYDAVLTLFPFVHGFFLRGGGGLSTLTVPGPNTGSLSYLGTNVLLGAGWAFLVAPPVNVTLGVDWTHPFFGAANVTGGSIWMMRIGLGLY